MMNYYDTLIRVAGEAIVPTGKREAKSIPDTRSR